MSSTQQSAFTLHTSFSPLLSLYDTFLLDQFGVIHNGSESLHGAKDCILEMINQNKRMAILSNTSSPSHVAKQRLPKYGLSSDMFEGGLVSSGEECAKFIREERRRGKMKKALWLTWQESEKQNPMQFLSYCESDHDGNDDASSRDLMIDVAESVEEADFILLHGSEVWRKCRELTSTPASDDELVDLNFLFNKDFTVIDNLLEEALQRSLPMVCANPDFLVGLPKGVMGNMPGAIAHRYQQKGGFVHQFGKPNTPHFHACLKNLGISFDTNAKSVPRVAHVGDSLEHDIVGANAAGIDSVFVLGGIHAEELGLRATSSKSDECGIVIREDEDDSNTIDRQSDITKGELTKKLQSFFEKKGIYPTHVVPSLSL